MSEIQIRVVGPYSSDILLDMAKELEPGNRTSLGWQARLESINFYAYEATVDDKELCKKVPNCDTREGFTVHDFFKKRGIPYTAQSRPMTCLPTISSMS